MKAILVFIMIFSSSIAFAGRGVATAPQITTDRQQIIYGEQSKKLYQTKEQTVCQIIDGKKSCHKRGVAQLIDLR